jgi:cytochrome c oxidase assembly protein subunit 15
MTAQRSPDPWLRRYAKLVCCSTFFLIFVGSLVTSTGSGLSVPDWPLSYGMLFPPMVGGIFYEHGHRMVAASVGFLTLMMAAWLAFAEQRRWLRNLGFLALAAVIAQGLLGGIAVLFLLPTPVSVSHAVLAQTFLLLTIVVAYGLSRERSRREQHSVDASLALQRVSVVALAIIFVQLILGALMRHTGSGLAIPDFPLTGGHLVPAFDEPTLARINAMRFDIGLRPVTIGQVVIHFAHRLGALFVLLAVAALTTVALRSARTQRRITMTVLALDLLVVLQVTLGALTVWSRKAPYVTSLHVLTGALVLGTCMLLVLRSHPVRLTGRPRGAARSPVPPAVTVSGAYQVPG